MARRDATFSPTNTGSSSSSSVSAALALPLPLTFDTESGGEASGLDAILRDALFSSGSWDELARVDRDLRSLVGGFAISWGSSEEDLANWSPEAERMEPSPSEGSTISRADAGVLSEGLSRYFDLLLLRRADGTKIPGGYERHPI